MKNKLYVCKTTWEHFVTLLSVIDNYNMTGEKSYLIVEVADENIKYFEKIKKLSYFEKATQVSLIQNKLFKFISFKYRTKISLKNKLREYLTGEFDIRVFVDQSVISQTFIKNGVTLDLYEHGNGNYLVGAFPNYPILKRILGVTEGYGRSDAINNIYLQYPDKSPLDIKSKVKKLDIRKMFDNLTQEQKNDVLDIFDIPDIKSNNATIILTQPLSEDKFMSEDKKIKIYKEMVSNQDSNIVIKPHPRDNTDYKSIFDKNTHVSVLSKSFPIEILNFLNVYFNKAITVCSGSVYNFSYPINIEILGTEIFPELMKPLGIIKGQVINKENSRNINYK
ncbi:TPA: glycosyltransferase family 52 [Photobacterium damselae]